MVASVTQLLLPSIQNQDVPQSVLIFVKNIIGDKKPLGVIYYGSSLWKNDLTGVA